MAEHKTVFVCQLCGATSPKWIGRCPSCHEWNTYVEEVLVKDHSQHGSRPPLQKNAPVPLTKISPDGEPRISLPINELNRVLGGGLVPGSVVLIGGEPGIGKSTLALQLALQLKNAKTLYVSGEESLSQIRFRAGRMDMQNESCFFLSETSLENILSHLQHTEPDLVIIDSIQTLYTERVESSPGSVSQVRECSNQLLRHAKENNLSVFLIGHINKEGALAGPKVLEHIVDTVLQFEGDHHHLYRILRTVKNRFGSTSELGIFEMQQDGLKEVLNPSEHLITQHDENLSGSAVGATIDGIRPFLIETQALVSSAVYGTPQRSGTGFDARRLNMLLAVLEKRAGFRLGASDVFLNIAGGIRVQDPALDLAVVTAILSSSLDVPVSKKICFSAEVGLSGEIRPVSRIDIRIREATRLRFEKVVISRYNARGLPKPEGNTEVIAINRIEDLVKKIFR
ncbi:MAG TPA: DNA repair protein RadA [Bacteroidetes bacterium]|nr:DNA repair protein RadA [Bacteroidota bacterium]